MGRLRAFNLGREVEMDAYRRRSTISNSNISNQIGGPKTSLSEMSNSMIPPPGNNHGYHHGGQHGGHSDRHHNLQRRKSSIFVDTSMWFKSYFVKPRAGDNRFAMQRRASALNQNNMSVGQLSSSKHSLNGGTLTRGNNSINSNVFNSSAVGSNVPNSGTLITSNNVLDQYNVQASCPKSGMNRLHSTSSPSYQIGSRSSPNVLNKTIVMPIQNNNSSSSHQSGDEDQRETPTLLPKTPEK